MLVSVGSKNRTKVEAVKEALDIIGLKAEIVAMEVDSGVSSQPYCKETLFGARNRAIRALRTANADIGIGIEGGICFEYNRVLAFAVVYAVDKDGNENFSKSAAFTLPSKVVKYINQGFELGYAVDKAYSKSGSKYSEGAVGILTKYIDRKRLYVDPVILALYPFYNKNI
ncbi:DUF84 family protein [Acidianus infernus]|uniref:DUF84 family protein n=1 Tax=Acidianus infernus TaxID=12915 RepID=UPI003593ACBC